jgi:uncharacterized protein (TIGR03435 family)
MKTIFAGAILALLLQIPAGADDKGDKAEFDAVSIKPSAIDARGGGYNIAPGRITAKNQTLKQLVQFAWDMHDYQVTGGAGWTDADHYEIVMTFPADTPQNKRLLMTQSMLADRFALKIRHEQKEVSGYALVVVKGAPKLKTPAGSQEGLMLSRNPAGLRTLTGTSAKMSGLASILADLLGKPVEDQTGLNETYDFNMAWSPQAGVETAISVGPGKKVTADPDAENGPSIFTALQTLGLKLETHKVAVDSVVIESAEKPSAN